MECTIFLINKEITTIKEAEELLRQQVTKTSNHYISKKLQDQIIQEFYKTNLNFNIEEHDDYVVIDFNDYDYGLDFTEKNGEVTFYYDRHHNTKEFIDHLETVLSITDHFKLTKYCPMIDEVFDDELGEMDIIELMRSELDISKKIPKIKSRTRIENKKQGYSWYLSLLTITVMLLGLATIIFIVYWIVVGLGSIF